MERFQLFIHRHYDAIKLGLIVIIFILTFIAVIGQIQKASQDSVEREAAVAELLKADQAITQSIKDETEAQTKIINRQFRALCILIIETSGQEGLDKLDADSRAQCERLADDPEATQETAVEQQEDREQQSRPEQSQIEGESDSSSNSTSAPEQNPQDSSQETLDPAPEAEEPQPNIFRRTINTIRGWLNNLL